MRTALSTLAVLEPASVPHALRMLRDEEGLVPLAGATDLYVELNSGALPHRRFLNIWGLSPLRRITLAGDTLRIGALATFCALIRSRHVRARLPMLVQAARQVGGAQIQNRGTLGGNVANGSPAGDTLPVLAAAEAIVVLQSVGAERRIPFTELYRGYRESVRRPDELIIAIEVPPLEGAQWFRKVGTRAAQSISKVVMAGVRAGIPRIALGSVAPTVVRLTQTERALAGGAGIEAAVRALDGEIHPVDDLRSSAAYRRRVSANLLRRFWLETSPAGQ